MCQKNSFFTVPDSNFSVLLNSILCNGRSVNPRTNYFRHYIIAAVLFLAILPANAQKKPIDWNVVLLDKILASVPAGQKLARVGDMEILVSNLRAWRNHLTGEPSLNLAFDGDAPIWTGGNVYYTFDANVSAAKQKAFLDGAKEWATFANLHFIPHTLEPNYFTVIENPSLGGGQSAVGMVGGQQFLQIGPNAWNRGTICHELGHTLGLIHEHQRSDRDSFITILTENIFPGDQPNFIKLTNSRNQGAYDFLSVMHYARNAFSTDPDLNTMEPLPAYSQFLNILGQGDPVLTPLDRAGMAAIYGAAPPNSPDVTNTQDSGLGSLRAAIYYGYDHPGTTITFHIPTSDAGFSNNVFNFLPTDQLPSLWNATLIDGGTQPNSNPDGPEILLNGALAWTSSAIANGLHFRGTNCAAHSLTISGFAGYGILIEGTNAIGNAVVGCFLGTDPTGAFAVTNGISPIAIGGGARSNFIGSPVASGRNIISGSASQGVVIRNAGTKNNFVRGNYIGLNAAGNAPLPNSYSGIIIYDGAQSNVIGGTLIGARNVISGNGFQGIVIVDTNSSGNRVEGNLIGVNPTGDAAIANGSDGIGIYDDAQNTMIGGTDSGARNVISGNGGFGILVLGEFTTNVVIQGNFIGSDLNGTTAISNAWDGIAVFDGAALIGGTTPGAGNLISGNGAEGISIAGTNFNYSVVQGNLIGVDVSGANALSNAFGGININGKSNLIGGTLPAMRNIISGNGGSGVSFIGLGTTDNRVEGNFLGLNLSGTGAIPNLYSGVFIGFGAQSNIVGGGVGTRNFISGNRVCGIAIGDTNTSGNLIQGNTIGLNSANGAAVPNESDGILIFNAQSNQIGGLAPGVGNIIAGNSNYAVISIGASATNNSIRANSIFENGFEGIRFFDEGNRSIGAPNLSFANLTTNLNVFGHVTLEANSSVELDFYASPFSPVSAQGKTYIGTRSISSTGGGTTNFSFALNAIVSPEQFITATMTDSDGNTSPFSNGVEVSMTSSANDEIPDAWRALYFGGNGAATNNQSCATCDPDGDGANNSEEFFSGTNPTNSASLFQISSALTEDGVVVELPSTSGISYRLESRDAFEANGWSILADQIIGTGTNIFVTDPASTVFTKRFYRAKILP